MYNIKKLLCSLITCLPLLIYAQAYDSTQKGKGIKWITGKTLEQIKQRAKAENKYIFLDCFTTWCGPCKMMDASVYGNDSVGDYYNDRFISVKLQMDQTKKDNVEVQRMYRDVTTINEQFHVNAYPCFIILSPQGTIVDKQIGFKGVKDFITLAKNATVPGKVYNDPYADYNYFVAEYRKGKRDYNHYPAMIIGAKNLRETDFLNQLLKEFSVYVSSLPRKERYTVERIKMWNQLTFPSDNSVFRFFYRNGKLIDKVMKQKGYADKFVDKTIQSEIVVPFFTEQNKNRSIAMSGMYLTGEGLTSDTIEANWNKLEEQIKEKYNLYYAKRNVLKAKVEWYKRHRNMLHYVECSLDFLNKYWSIDLDGPWEVNNVAWDAFVYSTDKQIINGYIKWMEKVVTKFPEFSESLDTYANLLYKSGRKQEAIQWEEKVVNQVAESYKKMYAETIEQMQNGQPTYVDGVDWKGINTVSWKDFKYFKWIIVKDTNSQPIGSVPVYNKRSGELKKTSEKGSVRFEVSAGDHLMISVPNYEPQDVIVGKDPGYITVNLKPTQKGL